MPLRMKGTRLRRALALITPAGLEKFFEEVGSPMHKRVSRPGGGYS